LQRWVVPDDIDTSVNSLENQVADEKATSATVSVYLQRLQMGVPQDRYFRRNEGVP